MLLGLLRRNVIVKKDTLKSCLQFGNPKLQVRFLETRQRLRMNEAFVRYDEDSDRFDISFRYINKDLVVDRQYNFNRQVNEPIESFLKRIDANVSKTLIKKKKKGLYSLLFFIKKIFFVLVCIHFYASKIVLCRKKERSS